jgi:hypothetical protein
MAPTVSADPDRLDPDAIAQRLVRAANWLTPESVEGYDPDEFKDFPKRDELDQAVNEFRQLAAAVGAEQPASDQQFQAGGVLVQRIVELVADFVLSEWRPSVEKLLRDAEGWAQKQNWPCRWETKQLNERLLGTYELPQLFIQAGKASLLLDPIGRFVPACDGLVDFSLIPSYHSAMIQKTEGSWRLRLERGKTVKAAKTPLWSEESFLEAAKWLGQRA